MSVNGYQKTSQAADTKRKRKPPRLVREGGLCFSENMKNRNSKREERQEDNFCEKQKFSVV